MPRVVSTDGEGESCGLDNSYRRFSAWLTWIVFERLLPRRAPPVKRGDPAAFRRPGPHERRVNALFGKGARFDGSEPVFESPLYLLAFVNRSGSNLLAEYLRMTPGLSGFREQLNHATVERQSRKLGVTGFPDYLRAISAGAVSRGLAHGFKASWDQILMLHRLGILRMYPEVRVIHIQREDVVAQAVSYLIARQTREWSSRHEGRAERACEFDADGISRLIGTIMESDRKVAQVCALFELPRRTVCYEDLVDDPQGVVRSIGTFTGQDLSGWSPRAPGISRQASALNEAFRRRYLEMAREVILDA